MVQLYLTGKIKYWKKIYTGTTLYIRKFTLTIPSSNPVFYDDNWVLLSQFEFVEFDINLTSGSQRFLCPYCSQQNGEGDEVVTR